jgi:hypothetical protein
MQEAANKTKQQIVDKIKSSTNILVTVSNNPSVDELTAALGLTALLNKLNKHATAIFSGAIPPAITFLEPDKVFENTADSLRDFIIALDKEKADHLRYKVEGDMVKIFVTPYRTHITSDDLEFSQGDFNIEVVLALGVTSQEHLDAALTAHGQIMSDVSIMTLSAGNIASKLGSVDWHDEGASSLSEMVGVLSTEFQTEKSLLDQQISTALLTGIVSATDRFSNNLTSSRVMAMAAQMMAAGADQQLIAAKLQESHVIDSLPIRSLDKEAIAEEKPVEPSDNFMIPHEEDLEGKTIEQIEESLPTPRKVVEEPEEPEQMPISTLPMPPELPPEIPEIEETPSQVSTKSEMMEEPLLGGILNATSDQAAEDARRELEDQQNKTILAHSYLGGDASQVAPINSAIQEDSTKDIDIFDTSPNDVGAQSSTPIEPNTTTTIPPSIDIPLPPPPPVPDFSTLPPTSTLPPDFDSTLPSPQEELPSTSTLPDPNDPSQFKIPTQ